jgi:hypothetical protein
VRQAAGTGRGVADGLAIGLDQPGRLCGIGEIGARALQPVGLGKELREVLGLIEMTKGLDERIGADPGQDFGVVGPGATGCGFRHRAGGYFALG